MQLGLHQHHALLETLLLFYGLLLKHNVEEYHQISNNIAWAFEININPFSKKILNNTTMTIITSQMKWSLII